MMPMTSRPSRVWARWAVQGTLNDLGIYQFRQIARFTPEDIGWVDERLKFKGRIERDDWISQAAQLHRDKHGTDPHEG